MNKKPKRKQKKAEKRRQQEIACIEAYLQELLENVNLKVICNMEAEAFLQENLLWAEEITIEEIVYPKRKHFSFKRFFSALFRKFHKVRM
ncbi:MAG: hypothetical protein K2I22_09390 [Lachnospiraceae bacterium]|nr:hypothetical protein [Lachnospiraceae bacterium]